MARKQRHKKLFKHRSDNLQGVCPRAGDVFVCPICFTVFCAENLDDDLDNELMGIGHVWPKFIRKSSETAKHQQVLLCTNCNSQAGGHAEGIMQEFENFRGCREAGEFYKPRARVFPTSKVAKPVELPAYVERLGKNQFRLMVERNRKGQPLCDPRELQKAGQHLAHGPCSISVNDVYPASAKWPHAQAAWLTDAYLLAFYAFGYRYIFQACLDPVREYIRNSFANKVDDRLKFQELKATSVRTCNVHFSVDPEVSFIIPIREDTPHHLEVSFLDYHVRLPLQYTFSIVIPEEVHSGSREVRDLFVDGSDHVAHAPPYCTWDILFGEPDYRVEEHTLTLKSETDTSDVEKSNGT